MLQQFKQLGLFLFAIMFLSCVAWCGSSCQYEPADTPTEVGYDLDPWVPMPADSSKTAGPDAGINGPNLPPRWWQDIYEFDKKRPQQRYEDMGGGIWRDPNTGTCYYRDRIRGMYHELLECP